MDGVVDRVEVRCLGSLGEVEFTLTCARFRVCAHLQVLFSAVGQHFAEQLRKTGSVVSFFKRVSLERFRDFISG